MSNYPVAVIIPIYKKELNYFEIISLKQCFKIFSQYHIIFVAPPDIDFKVYFAICTAKYQIVHFKTKYFQSIKGYNELMLSADFYKTFLSFKFILIYQLDAFVFKDELIYWCKQNYDFIGAPHPQYDNLNREMQFLKNYSKVLMLLKTKWRINHKISNVGNGGLSLRKTKSFYLLLKILKNKAKNWPYNEDSFFEYWGNLFYPFFNLPTDDVALRFSIETLPKESLKKLNYDLPFGCHAFEKYDWQTWKPYIINE
ncbi:DUF5672 family protein [Mucilaginibacter sp.]|uniref:DUF5672 family protein n=1 Tax=Mucilaginibacter sp. TaxID=1882438 RepID=UPI002627517D|nr:DUF5672 family protein [Mucilaginibacter sp.]MDB4926963.1 hypothetical protein [Mucilaginibacter sp.]